ncbi:MAG: flagellar type III secretion system pore protein FliP [Candidatus Jidaibacter sp.]|jgi:flagellar biosynthetic protein FliP|nr:flagellar type III secretion system pore protein FliP [Candidatus Jidaibacter sp.]
MRIFSLVLATLFFMFMLSEPAFAQGISIDLGNSKTPIFTSKVIQIIALITLLSLAPSILVMVTSFTRIVIVLSFLRTAIGLQQTPPNSVLISLALFLTMFIMAPTFEQSYEIGIKPLMNEEIEELDAFPKITQPFKTFMLSNTRDKDLSLFLDMGAIETVNKAEIPLHVVIPSFMLSELKRAFEIGFLIFLPFLIIDMLVASTLMAMGMMMIPPVMISLPFKLIFFVLIDGWYMLCGSLVKSYGL